jgi:hypothetical protein
VRAIQPQRLLSSNQWHHCIAYCVVRAAAFPSAGTTPPAGMHANEKALPQVPTASDPMCFVRVTLLCASHVVLASERMCAADPAYQALLRTVCFPCTPVGGPPCVFGSWQLTVPLSPFVLQVLLTVARVYMHGTCFRCLFTMSCTHALAQQHPPPLVECGCLSPQVTHRSPWCPRWQQILYVGVWCWRACTFPGSPCKRWLPATTGTVWTAWTRFWHTYLAQCISLCCV